MIDAEEFIHSAGYSAERANLSYEEIGLLYLLEHPEIEYKDAIDVISRFGIVFGDKEYKENREVHDINADSYKDYTNNDFYKDVEFEDLSIKNDKFLKKEIEKNEKLPDGSGFLFFEIYGDKKTDSFIKGMYNALKNDEFSVGKKPTFICRFEVTKLLIFFKNISLSCLNKIEEASKARFIEYSLVIKMFYGIENIKSVYDELNKKPEMERM